jgi:hypothetical protein
VAKSEVGKRSRYLPGSFNGLLARTGDSEADPIVAIGFAAKRSAMSKIGCWIFAGAALMIAIITIPIWGMGPAVYLDSERTIRTSKASPDDSKIASVEEIVVGGVPSIVIIVRDRWLPSWYFTGCVVSSHYEDVDVSVEWVSNTTIKVLSEAEPSYWNAGRAPFRNAPCTGISTMLISLAAK